MNFLQTLSEMEEWNGGQGPVEQVAPSPKKMKQASGKKTLMHMLYRTQAEEEEVTAQHDGLIKFFQDNPQPSEEDMNAFAEEMGTDPDALDERIYALLSSLLKGVGKSNDMSDDEFDPEQLAKGVEAEMEHTEDEIIAKMIAKDHLADIPDYYDRLGQMEDEAGDEANAEADVDLEMGDEENMGADEEMDLEMDDDEYGDEEDDMTMSDEGEMDDVMDPNYEDDPEGDMDDEDEYDDDEINMDDDEDEDSEYASGDLEDDEFEVNLGRKDDTEDDYEDRPRKKKKLKKRVKRLTFKESLMQG